MSISRNSEQNDPNIPEDIGPKAVPVAVRLLPGGYLPRYTSRHAAGCDLTATADVVIRPGETVVLPLGFIMALPPDCEAQVRPRSGLSLRTMLRLPNAPGTIDADYRDEVGVILENAFSPAILPGLIAARPSLLAELQARYRLVRLRDLLPAPAPVAAPAPAAAPPPIAAPAPAAVPAPVTALPQVPVPTQAQSRAPASQDDPEPMTAAVADQPASLLTDWLDQLLWVDAEGLPYGTIRIRAGERIAQLVVTEIRRAVFDPESDPLEVGHNRGGGFGSTGVAT